MSRINDLGLTKEQSKIYRVCYQKAKEYFNLPKGWVLHHKDPTLQFRDLDRYIHWYIEDLELMSKAEHRRWHALYDNPMNYEEYRRKVSEAKIGKPSPLKGDKEFGKKTAERNTGRHWYNNGFINVFVKEPPEGFILGRLAPGCGWKNQFSV